MVGPFIILIYVSLSGLIALLGRNTVVGFAGCFILGLLLTPFVVALILMMAAPRKKA